MDVKVELPYGTGKIDVRIPEENLIGVYSPKDVRPVADVKREVIRALASPIGSRPLRELARGARRAVIVADDNTRLTPADRMIPVLLDEMNAAGLQDEQITVIIALGTHRFMTPEEILAKFGAEVVRRVAVWKPFWIALSVLLLITYIPQLSTFLPRLLMPGIR